MSTLTRLLVESPRKVKESCKSAFNESTDGYDVASVVNESSLASLLAVVRRRKRINWGQFINEIEVLSVDDPEYYLVKVPEEIVSALAKKRTIDLSKLAKSWKEVDRDFARAGDDVTAADLEVVLGSMRKASIESVQLKKLLFVCTVP